MQPFQTLIGGDLERTPQTFNRQFLSALKS